MISVDRSSSRPITEQIASQLRYEIASGRYRMGDVLPSTRQLADQIGVSFHSVRKAYQALEREGLLSSRPGSGYTVRERAPLSKAHRIEQGAALVNDTIQQLVGLGLEADEIEYLFQEQLDLMAETAGGRKVVFAGSCPELSELCARQLAHTLQQNVIAATLQDLPQHQDADYIVAPFEALQEIIAHAAHSEVVGVTTHLGREALEQSSRLLPNQTVGVVAMHPDTIPALTAQLRRESGFSGQILAISAEKPGRHLEEFAEQVDLLIYTPECRRRLLGLLSPEQPNAPLAPVVSPDSLQALRTLIGS